MRAHGNTCLEMGARALPHTPWQGRGLRGCQGANGASGGDTAPCPSHCCGRGRALLPTNASQGTVPQQATRLGHLLGCCTSQHGVSSQKKVRGCCVVRKCTCAGWVCPLVVRVCVHWGREDIMCAHVQLTGVRSTPMQPTVGPNERSWVPTKRSHKRGRGHGVRAGREGERGIDD